MGKDMKALYWCPVSKKAFYAYASGGITTTAWAVLDQEPKDWDTGYRQVRAKVEDNFNAGVMVHHAHTASVIDPDLERYHEWENHHNSAIATKKVC